MEISQEIIDIYFMGWLVHAVIFGFLGMVYLVVRAARPWGSPENFSDALVNSLLDLTLAFGMSATLSAFWPIIDLGIVLGAPVVLRAARRGIP